MLHGAQDGLVPPAYGQRLASLIPNAAFQAFEGAAHMPMVEAEDAFAAAVASFLD